MVDATAYAVEPQTASYNANQHRDCGYGQGTGEPRCRVGAFNVPFVVSVKSNQCYPDQMAVQ